jgi:hypothetical protein
MAPAKCSLPAVVDREVMRSASTRSWQSCWIIASEQRNYVQKKKYSWIRLGLVAASSERVPGGTLRTERYVAPKRSASGRANTPRDNSSVAA